MRRLRNQPEPIDMLRKVPEQFMTAENRNKSLETRYHNNTISYAQEASTSDLMHNNAIKQL